MEGGSPFSLVHDPIIIFVSFPLQAGPGLLLPCTIPSSLAAERRVHPRQRPEDVSELLAGFSGFLKPGSDLRFAKGCGLTFHPSLCQAVTVELEAGHILLPLPRAQTKDQVLRRHR